MTRTRARLPSVLWTASLFACIVAVPFPAGAAQEEDKASASSLPPVLEKGTGDCQKLYEEIRAVHDALPRSMGGLSTAEADRIAREVSEMTASARRFAEECSTADSVQMAEVQFIRAKALYLLSQRYRFQTIQQMRADGVPDLTNSLREAMDAYYSEIQALAQPAFEGLPPDHAFRPDALRYYAQACSDARDQESALKAYKLYLELFPGAEDLDRVLLAIGRLHLDMGSYDVGIDVAERVQKEYYRRESYATAGELLWKLYHSSGDLEGLQRYVNTVETVYPLKLANKDLPDDLRSRLQLFLDFNGFRKGYTRFALGDCEGAIEAFKKHLAYMETRDNANPAAKVYTQRSRDVLAFVEKLGCKPAPRELDLEWATLERFSLLESRGKAIALVFRGLSDRRSASFLTPLWEVVKANPRMEMAVISYLRTGEQLQTQLQALRFEMDKLGYTGPAGFDPDGADKSLFRAYEVKVGSASLVVVDPKGRCVWFMEDPRGVDSEFGRVMLERALGAPPTEPETSSPKEAPEQSPDPEAENPAETPGPAAGEAEEAGDDGKTDAAEERTGSPEPAETSPTAASEGPDDEDSFAKYLPFVVVAGAVLLLALVLFLTGSRKPDDPGRSRS